MIREWISKLKGLQDKIPELIREAVEEDELAILDLNTEFQLYEQGVDRMGKAIRPRYTLETVSVKKSKGQITSHVTLKDEGDFYKSFKIVATLTQFEITALDFKTQALTDKYGKEILGLTDENLNEVIHSYIYPKIMAHLRNE